MKRDQSRSETDFGGSGSLRGSDGIAKTARKLGIFGPSKGHLIDSQQDVGGGREPADKLSLALIRSHTDPLARYQMDKSIYLTCQVRAAFFRTHFAVRLQDVFNNDRA